MKAPDILKRTLVHPYFSLAFAIFIFWILAQLGSAAAMLICAAGLSAYVWALPDHFRSRSGSLRPAFCLVSAMCFAAVVVAVLTLMGEVR
jgi:hypothetical protein